MSFSCFIITNYCLIFAKKMDNRDFCIDNVRLRPDEQIGRHSHSNWELSLVVKGSGIRQIGDTNSPFADDDLVIIPPEIPHCWHFDENYTDSEGYIANITIKFTTHFLEQCAATFAPIAHDIIVLMNEKTSFTFDAERKKKLTAIMNDIVNADAREQCHLIIKLLSIIISDGKVIAVGKADSRDRISRRLDSVRIYTSCNLNRHITIDEIARHVGMNRSAFCSFFKKATGESYVTYLNRRRIDKVCERLRTDDSSISDIAYTCGFNNMPYFNRTFRHMTGTNPSHYRATKK